MDVYTVVIEVHGCDCASILSPMEITKDQLEFLEEVVHQSQIADDATPELYVRVRKNDQPHARF